MELAHIYSHLAATTWWARPRSNRCGVRCRPQQVSDLWGALVDWYRDLKVTQVKYDLMRDASTISAAELRPSADEMEHQ